MKIRAWPLNARRRGADEAVRRDDRNTLAAGDRLPHGGCASARVHSRSRCLLEKGRNSESAFNNDALCARKWRWASVTMRS